MEEQCHENEKFINDPAEFVGNCWRGFAAAKRDLNRPCAPEYCDQQQVGGAGQVTIVTQRGIMP